MRPLSNKDRWALDVICGQCPPKQIRARGRKIFPHAVTLLRLKKLDWLYEALMVKNSTFFTLCYPSFEGEGKKKQKRRDAILHIIKYWHVRQVALARVRSSIEYRRHQLTMSLSTKK